MQFNLIKYVNAIKLIEIIIKCVYSSIKQV